mmetsp:Transcript_71737/g.198023  ORF Transcript_71737/g.198023 Transcript_71737/m.198023 type:complete len:208 (-) Transcript_71737:497-1120(-)
MACRLRFSRRHSSRSQCLCEFSSAARRYRFQRSIWRSRWGRCASWRSRRCLATCSRGLPAADQTSRKCSRNSHHASSISRSPSRDIVALPVTPCAPEYGANISRVPSMLSKSCTQGVVKGPSPTQKRLEICMRNVMASAGKACSLKTCGTTSRMRSLKDAGDKVQRASPPRTRCLISLKSSRKSTATDKSFTHRAESWMGPTLRPAQ